MRICKISSIKDYRVFRNFSWPSDLPTFARYNVIYGWNGSGKTTLSSLFGFVEKRKPVTEGQFLIELDNGSAIAGTDLEMATIPNIRVFNRDFVENTISAIRNDSISPISIFIGEKKVEEVRILEKTKTDLTCCSEALESVSAKLSEAENALSNFLTKSAKGIKARLLQFNAPLYANYNKHNFETTIKTIKESGAIVPLDESAKMKLQATALQTPKNQILFAVPSLPNLASLREQVSSILGESVVSKTIEELIRNPKLAGWIQSGLALHTGENASKYCRFCGNPLSEERKKQLEAHFNDAVMAFQGEIDTLLNGIEQYQLRLSGIQLPHPTQFYEEFATEYDDICLQVNELSAKLKARLQCYAELLKGKREHLFQSQTCKMEKSDDDAIQVPLQKSFDRITDLVSKHSQKTKTLDRDRYEAVRTLEHDMVLSLLDEYEGRCSARDEMRDEKSAKEKERDTLYQAKHNLELSLVETSKAADDLNKDLQGYLGRDEIAFSAAKGGIGYRLLRDGQPATNLSEGEQSAIAFLYFLRTLTDRSFDLTKGIVVIDDPVSSLDSNSLFTAFSFMKERIVNCEQVFVLTHSFVLFRQVANWFHHLKGQRTNDMQKHPARFYMLRTKGRGSSRGSDILRIDPLLEEFESEYHYLFMKVWTLSSAECNDELSSFYEIPNIARRVLEIFLAYQTPCHADGLYEQISRIEFDNIKKTVILRLLNICSHGEGIRDPEHDLTSLCEAKKALQYVLELIETLNPSHYSGMVELIKSRSEVQKRNRSESRSIKLAQSAGTSSTMRTDRIVTGHNNGMHETNEEMT